MQAGRELKFRAWDSREKEMLSWEQIDHLDTLGVWPFIEMVKGDRFELMQFTGLRDKNGKEIYEGDVVKGHHWDNGRHRLIGAVKYKAPEFYIEGVKQYEWLKGTLDQSYEVIGNIYENPELLSAT